jgi:ubiquinone/menaquinone biosynthesis C-methylase UbiE
LSELSHQAVLDRLAPSSLGSTSPSRIFGGVSDDFWLWAFTEGYRVDHRLRQFLPAFPPEDVQRRFAGAAGDDTMRDAFSIYMLIKGLVAQHLQQPLQSVLEFGCGWGRIIRLFLRDIEAGSLWGIDCLPSAIQVCVETNPQTQFKLVDPFPPTSFDADTFDLVYAYSVFSHLSERAHLEWLTEFTRILKPGGLAVLTTRPREFVLTCAAARAAGEQAAWAQGTVLAFKNTEEVLARYDRGEYVFEPMSGGDVLDESFFGETCIPRRYVENHWTRLFEVLEYLDDRSQCLQNVIVVRKRP